MATKKSLVLLIALVAPLVVVAQLGKNEAHCKKIWGTPDGELESNGVGKLKYSAAGTSVTLGFERGLVVTASYDKPDLGNHDVKALLELNRDDWQWDVWTPPGIPASEVQVRMWLRNDEMAMAELDGSTLNVFGSLAEPEPEPEPEQNPVEGSAQAAAASPENKAVEPQGGAEKVEVARPEQMPELGDSKETVFSILGDPSGIMESGGKEILVYGWGSIWIAGDKVVSIN